jgi:hypothetical protein
MSQDPIQVDAPSASSSIGCLARMFWMILGNLILVLVAAAIWRNSSALSLSLADLVYWALVASLIAVRYLDIRHFGGKTSDGERAATMTDWIRYASIVVAVTLVVWLVLHAAAWYRG